MELKEICQQSFQGDFHNGFSLISNWPNDNRYALIKPQKSAVFLTTQNCADVNTPVINLKWNSIVSSLKIPTQTIIQNTDMGKIYHNSTILERQGLLLDPLYGTEFAKAPKEPQIINVAWPLEEFKCPIVAVTNHYGVCEIFTKIPLESVFDESKIYINDKLNQIFDYDKKNIQSYQELRECVENFCINCCCFVDNSKNQQNDDDFSLQLICATESGWIIAFNVTPWKAECLFKIKTNLKSIKFLKSFSFTTKGVYTKFLFIADAVGILKIYQIHENEFKEISNLWNKEDRMSCQSIEIEYHENLDKLFVNTVKASHFIAFVLTSDGIIYNKTHYYIGNFVITGMQQIKPLEYIICTINGYIEHIQILYSKNELKIKSCHIKHDLPIENNKILGMMSTPNKVGWLFVMNYNKYKKKSVNYLSTCALNVFEPLDILMNTEQYFMENYFDCTEMIRLKLMYEYNIEEYVKFSPGQTIQLNEKFLHRLRIRKVILNGIASQNWKKLSKSTPQLITEELKYIDETILILYLYFNLEYLCKLKKLTNFQKLSGSYMKKMLTDYLNNEINNEYYNHIKNILNPLVTPLLTKTVDTFKNNDNYNEKCVYCDEEIDLDRMMCSSNHDVQRCCITLVQVPAFTSRHCSQCKRMILEDDNLLNEILNLNNFKKLRCPFCAVPFIYSHFET